ncbi:phosphatidylinositol-specific phospholipase [Mollisia scopiformis]|uniref:Phosphatidylinositol-specific phospholipase n=1 Tax=Mollisia scopiformis TaxID=149040 RepID=A0A194X5U6_MOLSC|nr:phosphatidylinositol-specific phospholipase [Mollisia scopiformis]KUJ15449.1 phosphatidylinositol-specific phospholipase [Mollisia scopiformis]
MSWITRGLNDDGFVQDTPNGQTPSVPALATHHGELWCLWSDPSGLLFYARGDNNVFQPRLQFPDQGIPVIAELSGQLHAIIVRDNGEMAHYVFSDVDQLWTTPAILDPRAGFIAHSTPAFVAFHNKLFLVFVQDNNLYYSIWAVNPQDETTTWTPVQDVSGIKQVSGIPALFVLDGTLHVLCSSNDESREILCFAYDVPSSIWNSASDISEGRAATGVSATSYGDSAFLAFQENGPDDESHTIYISEYKDGKWAPQEAVAGQTSTSPPQLAVLNGRINCIFNANDAAMDLRWYSRALLDFSLSSWMGGIPDDTLLSDITVPGTHDTCAMSNIPFVRTQYLNVKQQMEAGLRFLDLRCRVHPDGQLYMYHGGIPINFPKYLKFDDVMQEVFTFFLTHHPTPTETVLVSINNDDTAQTPANTPSIFYQAVATHIANTPLYPDGTSRWLTSPTTSTLGLARGKAVLLRRYQPDPTLSPSSQIGLDLSGWLNNNPDFTLLSPAGVQFTLQDHWQYSDIQPLAQLIESKFSYVSNMLSKAASSSPEHWFLNFTSAVGDPVEKGEVAESHWIAVGAHSGFIGKFVQGMNVTTRRSFDWGAGTEREGGRKRYGVIAMDYPELPKDSDLIAWLIGTNF